MNLHVFEGHLWRGDEIIRRDYARHRQVIKNRRQLRASLRAGQWAWPGGYEVIYIDAGGLFLCHECVIENYKLIAGGDWDAIVGTCLDCELDEGVCSDCGRAFCV